VRAALLTIGLALALPACSNPGPGVTACRTQCPICKGADEVCAGAGGGVDWNAQCLPVCATDDECPGAHCVDVIGDSSGVCVTAIAPSLCSLTAPDAGFSCDPGPASCGDATTLLLPYAEPANHVCGLERVHCPVACETGADGGSADGGAAAHCR
jgi:hypothetical protein